MSSPELMTGLGCTAAIFLSAAGSSYATAYSGLYALRSNVNSEIKVLHSFAPVVVSGVLAIYGAIVAYILYTKLGYTQLSVEDGYRYFASGLTVGAGCLASGLGMGKFIQGSVLTDVPKTISPSSSIPQESTSLLPVTVLNSFTKGGFAINIFVYIFIEAIGLYSLCIALLMSYDK